MFFLLEMILCAEISRVKMILREGNIDGVTENEILENYQ
ncbi:hypothetical protein J2S16_000542 [Cytobacillus kochii]|nr:hypothetical protein [Cytobacillus kochii]